MPRGLRVKEAVVHSVVKHHKDEEHPSLSAPRHSPTEELIDIEEQIIEDEREAEAQQETHDDARRERLHQHQDSMMDLKQATNAMQEENPDHDLLDTEDENVKRLIQHSLTPVTQVRVQDMKDFLHGEIKRTDSFKDLPITLLFAFLFVISVLGHDPITDSGLIQRQLRGMIEGTTFEGVHFSSGHKDITSIDMKEDIYTFLREAFLPSFLNPAGSEGSASPRILRYSRLVGGVQIQQLRRERRSCEGLYNELGPKTKKGWCTGGSSTDKERCRGQKFEFDCNKMEGCKWEEGPRNPMLVDKDCFPWSSNSKSCFAPPALVDQGENVPSGWCPDSVNLPTVWLANATIGKTRRALLASESSMLSTHRKRQHRQQIHVYQRVKDHKAKMKSKRSRNNGPRSMTRRQRLKAQRRKSKWLPEAFGRFREWAERDHTMATKNRILLSDEKAQVGGDGAGADHPGADSDGQPFSVYMYEHKGLEGALQKLSELQQFGWIDEQTAWLGITILVFCPELGMFVHVTTMVHFMPSGELVPDLKAQSFVPNPYINLGAAVCDVLLIIMLFTIVVRHIQAFYSAIRGMRFKFFVGTFFYWLDLLTCVGGIAIVLAWIFILDQLAIANEIIVTVSEYVPTPETEVSGFPATLAEMHRTVGLFSDHIMWFRIMVMWYILFLVLRIFESFSGQPRLGVVTNTFLGAATDFFHYFILWLIITLCFTICGMFLFGRRVYDYSSIGLAFQKSVLIGLLGEFDWEELGAEHPATAGLWFWMFMAVDTLILINMIMAIIMDVYMDVKNDAHEFESIWITARDFIRDQRRIRKEELVDAKDILRILKQEENIPAEIDQQYLERLTYGSIAMGPEQARKLILRVKDAELKNLRGSTQLSSTFISIGWIKMALREMGDRVHQILMGEAEEKRFLELATGQKQANEKEDYQRLKAVGPFVEHGSIALGELEDRTERLAQYMNEAMDYTLYRGKDVRNRLAVIEGLLRQRHQKKMSSAEEHIWEQPPPFLGDPPQIEEDNKESLLMLSNSSQLNPGGLALRDLSLEVEYDPTSNMGSPLRKAQSSNFGSPLKKAHTLQRS